MAACGRAAWPPGRVARLARWPGIALCRAPNLKVQSVPMKGVRINEIWYKQADTVPGQHAFGQQKAAPRAAFVMCAVRNAAISSFLP